MSNCDSCGKRPPEPVPYVAHEADMARQERTIKRLWILLLVLIALLAGSNAAWIYYESQLTEHRSILRDHWFEGKSTKELADKYKKSETAIKEVFRLGDRILLRAAKMSATK